MSSKVMEALNQMAKDDAFAAFKACCGSAKYAQVADACRGLGGLFF
jgi:coproporphyrinogen III oxidase